MGDRIEVAGEKTPDQNIDRHKDENGEDALRAAAVEIEHPQHDGANARSVHRLLPCSASCATLTNRSSRVAAPCSSGSVFGSPSSTIRPCDRNSTRSQTAWTSYMLWLPPNTPQSPLSTNLAMPARMSRAFEGSMEAVGSSRSSSRGRLSIALARERRVCSPDERTPAFVLR